ncbi:EamA family transporter [Candidatus Daviesbacteria bacterium]|nr:EamA family transporter [Candidatus Daviesbacteria bacterium]
MGPYWFLLAVGAGLASNLANFTTRYLIKDDKDSASFSLSLEVSRVLAFGILAFFDFYINWSLKTITLLLLLGFIEPLAVYTFMKMHEHTHLSISSIVSRSRMIWVAVIAFLFLGESLKLIDYIGIVILFLGLSMAIAPHRIFIDKGIKISLLMSLIAAVVVVLIKAVSSDVSLPVIITWMSLPSVFIIPLFMKTPQSRIKGFVSNKWGLKVLFNIFNFFAFYGYTLAIKHGSVSIVTAIYHGMTIFAVIAGIIFLREREDIAKKIIGAIVTFLGVFLLAGIS